MAALRNLNPDKALGPDGIPGRILKESAQTIAPSLTLLFNKSLHFAVVPHEWKLANVVPIFKKGVKDHVQNYRPISLLCVVSKLLERCVLNHIWDHLQEVINDCQHGFMPSRSCTSQLIGVLDKIGNFLDRGEQIDVIYLDMTKAFDRVNHELLLSKLRHFGFKNNLLNWFQSYLFQRRQQVTVLGSTSSSLPVVSGVPQGSILGPVLFLLYVNDLPDAVSSSTVATFADDTKLFKTIACKADSLKLPEDLNTLTQWSTSTNLAFNPAKCLFAVMKNGLFNTNVSGALFPLGMVTWPPWNNSTTVLTSIVLRVQPLMTTMQLGFWSNHRDVKSAAAHYGRYFTGRDKTRK